MEETGRLAFAAFREAVFNNARLMRRVRNPSPTETYVADVVAVGATMGYDFDVHDVHVALRVGAQTWSMQGVDFEP